MNRLEPPVWDAKRATVIMLRITVCSISYKRQVGNNFFSTLSHSLYLKIISTHGAVLFLDQGLQFSLRLGQLLRAFPREADSFLEELKRLIQRQLASVEKFDDLLKSCDGLLEGHFVREFHVMSALP